jgi:hypothetical protein
MKRERLHQLLTQGVPEFMEQVCALVARDVKAAGLDGIEMATLWKQHAPEKSRAWMRDVMMLCRARGQVQLAFCGSHYLWCLPELQDEVQGYLNARFAAEMVAARQERLDRIARQEQAAALALTRPATPEEEHDTWPVVRSLVSAAECELPRNLPVRSVFEWRGAA